MKEIKKKLKKFEKMLSVKHLARDIIGLQVVVLLGTLVAALAFVGLVSYASTQADPTAVMQNTHEATSGIYFWVFYAITNILVFAIGNKHKKAAAITKEEIIAMVEPEDEVEE